MRPRPRISPGASLTVEALDSPRLGSPLRYRLYLPPGHDRGGARLPLLLLLHGNGGDEYGWDPGIEALDELIGGGRLPPLMAVAPGTGTSWWVDGPRPVESVVIGELIPHLRRRLPAPPPSGPAERLLLAGYSMGGYGAVRYALRYPQLFSGAIALSAALYDELPPPDSSARSSGAFGNPFDGRRWSELNYPALLPGFLRRRQHSRLFIAAGDGDWNQPAGWRYNCEYQSLLLFERLCKEGGSPAALRIDEGGHDWGFWRPKFAAGLHYLLGEQGRASEPAASG